MTSFSTLLIKRFSDNTQQEEDVCCHLQHSMGLEATCKERVLPLACGIWTLKTRRTRVFFRPMSVSPLRSSMSEFRSFNIPAQSMLPKRKHRAIQFTSRLQEDMSVQYLPSLLHARFKKLRQTQPSDQAECSRLCLALALPSSYLLGLSVAAGSGYCKAHTFRMLP